MTQNVKSLNFDNCSAVTLENALVNKYILKCLGRKNYQKLNVVSKIIYIMHMYTDFNNIGVIRYVK